MSKHSFLLSGTSLVDGGFHVIPLAPRSKRPKENNWAAKPAPSAADIKRMSLNGSKHGNVGIATSGTPAVDLDILDADLADEMEDFVTKLLGDAPVRIGQAPKRLLLFRTDQPFTKVQVAFVDDEGVKHKIEVLAHGQQFAAYGIHPDTEKPFTWVTEDHPAMMDRDELPEITLDDARAIREHFIELCEARGWKLAKRENGVGHLVDDDGEDDDDYEDTTRRKKASGLSLRDVRAPVDMSDDEIRDTLALLDPDEGYQAWVDVGMALHHQYAGGEDGLELFDEWSQRSADYDRDEIEDKWYKSFASQKKGGRVITFRSLIKQAQEARVERDEEEFKRLQNVIKVCNSESELSTKIAKEIGQADMPEHRMDVLLKKMQGRLAELTGEKPKASSVEKMIKKAAGKQARGDDYSGDYPEWLKGWCYVAEHDKFFNLDTKRTRTERAFNSSFDRFVRDSTLTSAKLALNTFKIDIVDDFVYLPGHPARLTIDNRDCANTYDESAMPEPVEPTTKAQLSALKRVRGHFKMLFPDKRERMLLLDYLAYMVQNPAKRVNYTVLIQGAVGAGKTYIHGLMSAVLSRRNVGLVNATTLAKSDFTGWAEGRKAMIIEEIKLAGANRFEVLEKLKPYFTNDYVEVHRKGKDSYDSPNVTNYIVFTNHWDAVPLDSQDRRWFVLSTSLQTKREVDDFTRANEGYFDKLFDDLKRHPGVLRWWLLNREFDEEFRPKGHAPVTQARQRMIEQSQSSESGDVLDIIVRADRPGLSADLVSMDVLLEEVYNDDTITESPSPKSISLILTRAGYVSIGRYRVNGRDKPLTTFYSQRPGLFPRGSELRVIRRMLGRSDDE